MPGRGRGRGPSTTCPTAHGMRSMQVIVSRCDSLYVWPQQPRVCVDRPGVSCVYPLQCNLVGARHPTMRHSAARLRVEAWLTLLSTAALVAGCNLWFRPYPAPTGARNNLAAPVIVRLIGTAGSVDYLVPPRSAVIIKAPGSIGTVGHGVMLNSDCIVLLSVPFGGQSTWFEYGGQFLFEQDGPGFGGEPPPSSEPDAVLTDRCSQSPSG